MLTLNTSTKFKKDLKICVRVGMIWSCCKVLLTHCASLPRSLRKTDSIFFPGIGAVMKNVIFCRIGC